MGFNLLKDYGMSIIRACGIDLPAATRSSSALSNEAESLPPASMIGDSFLMSSPKSGDSILASAVCIQNRLPLIVLISPLCPIMRKGWALFQEGKVLVLKREWIRAMALASLLS